MFLLNVTDSKCSRVHGIRRVCCFNMKLQRFPNPWVNYCSLSACVGARFYFYHAPVKFIFKCLFKEQYVDFINNSYGE